MPEHQDDPDIMDHQQEVRMNEHVDINLSCTGKDTSEHAVIESGQAAALPVTSQCAQTADHSQEADTKLFDRIGRLTRDLHNSLRELGYDRRLQQANLEISDSKDRLAYVISKTTQAAEDCLLAVESAQPIQENLSNTAVDLAKQWNQAFETAQLTVSEPQAFKEVLVQTLDFLNDVPKQTDTTKAYLLQVMMAQEFQDLTGQVIQNIARTIEAIEKEMLQLLIDNSPNKDLATSKEEGLMNGPVINPKNQLDTFSKQDQVDNLLAELGF
ncbi:protein phosphatase CheZ [Nitrosomonas halophila]|uniref:Protein phosphatase CheZ n=1 Tax=Nitrosomonas halophila TaxID=44576 RepID=A0A1H3LZW8_9PROT|nr:protein phosphatase CheZ [Nitrosomonas halophila]SDY69992.1 chemotaxis protein CheZ [Nitrosomonas halophila]